MQPLVVQCGYEITKTLWANRHPAPNSVRPGHIDLINVDHQFLTVPLQTAGSDLEVFRTALNALAAPLGHGPALAAFAIQSHIQRAKIFWIGRTAVKSSGQSVIRRKNAPHKSDDGQSVLAIITQRIDIPPEITTRRDLLVKPRSSISVAAANRPDMAAIGRPGPGCTLPPA